MCLYVSTRCRMFAVFLGVPIVQSDTEYTYHCLPLKNTQLLCVWIHKVSGSNTLPFLKGKQQIEAREWSYVQDMYSFLLAYLVHCIPFSSFFTLTHTHKCTHNTHLIASPAPSHKHTWAHVHMACVSCTMTQLIWLAQARPHDAMHLPIPTLSVNDPSVQDPITDAEMSCTLRNCSPAVVSYIAMCLRLRTCTHQSLQRVRSGLFASPHTTGHRHTKLRTLTDSPTTVQPASRRYNDLRRFSGWSDVWQVDSLPTCWTRQKHITSIIGRRYLPSNVYAHLLILNGSAATDRAPVSSYPRWQSAVAQLCRLGTEQLPP